MEIRALGESDAAAWWNLRLEALESEPFAFGRTAEEHRATPVETIATRFRNVSADNFTLGAFDGESLVGMATFVRQEPLKERHKGRIYGVYVTPAARDKRVGRALIEALLKRARADESLEQISLEVATCQKAAQRLYKGFGFESYGIEPGALKVGSEYIDEDHMVLRIR